MNRRTFKKPSINPAGFAPLPRKNGEALPGSLD